jgi:aminopeptidase N
MRPSPRLLLPALALLAACGRGSADPEFGVSSALAEHRARTISDLHYDVQLSIPASRREAVQGRVAIRFTWTDSSGAPVVLDFRGDTASLAPVTVNGTAVIPRTPNGHVLIPAEHLVLGANEVTLAFAASDEALNRQDDFLYALFVPDRASTAFPSFDQPDLKARYTVTIDAPPGWRAIANGAVTARDSTDERVRTVHAATQPMPTYLFTFAAGLFQVDSALRDGRWLTMYHRETDAAKVARNRAAIFDLHATALTWLEEYTGIPYPFEHFAFLAVPSFQFGGMEHPGAVWYRASSLFLDESATQQQYLGRASLIAHETAHMWFGDLVTMRWFNDVWMKEVFANFMAAKIVEPSFPQVDHRLRFFLAHHPTAYGVDRTLGANAIRQPLENLRQAGSLYGAIIYQKAPIVMQQLEALIGAEALRDGLREYLRTYRYGNATWPELIALLDARTPLDLTAWSAAWVEEAWRPQVEASWVNGELLVTQRDPRAGRGLRWTQELVVALGTDTGGSTHTGTGVDTVRVRLSSDTARVALAQRPTWILPGADGASYGRFVLNDASRQALLTAAPSLPSAMLRATAYHALWESVLAGSTRPSEYLQLLLRAIPSEREELISAQLLGHLRSAYWQYLPDSARLALAPQVAAVLREALTSAEGVSRKSALWSTYVSTARTPDALAWMERVWSGAEVVPGLPLSEPQVTALAEALALREVPNADTILTVQRTRISNPDRAARLDFVRPAYAADPAVRDSVVASLADVANRGRESWVLDALGAAAHPLRGAHAARYVLPGLLLVEEIQRTGDIFFPLGWLNALLGGQQSVASAEAIVAFLDASPGLPPRLRGKVLQAADDVFRAARVVHGWSSGPRLEHDPPPQRR